MKFPKSFVGLIAPLCALVWYVFSGGPPEKVDVGKLRVVDSFSIVMGSGAKHLFVFESVDCKYCAKLHPELLQLRDTTVHVFPLPGHSERSDALARAAWCSADQVKAWSAAFDGVVSDSVNCLGDALDRNLNTAKALGFTSTPTMILGDGFVISGYLGANDLRKIIQQRGL